MSKVDRREHQRRVDAAIAQTSASHMSNAKWLKFFAVLRDLNIWSLRWKFVRQEGVSPCPAPHESGLREDGLGDVIPCPYGPFREIEWVEVPTERASGLVDALATVGQFPVQELPTGVRLVAYSWPALEPTPGISTDASSLR